MYKKFIIIRIDYCYHHHFCGSCSGITVVGVVVAY